MGLVQVDMDLSIKLIDLIIPCTNIIQYIMHVVYIEYDFFFPQGPWCIPHTMASLFDISILQNTCDISH